MLASRIDQLPERPEMTEPAGINQGVGIARVFTAPSVRGTHLWLIRRHKCRMLGL